MDYNKSNYFYLLSSLIHIIGIVFFLSFYKTTKVSKTKINSPIGISLVAMPLQKGLALPSKNNTSENKNQTAKKLITQKSITKKIIEPKLKTKPKKLIIKKNATSLKKINISKKTKPINSKSADTNVTTENEASKNETIKNETVQISNNIGSINGKSDALPVATEEYLVSSMPIIKVEVKADYPLLAKQKKIEGPVLLDILIDDKGIVRTAKIIKGPGFGLNEAAKKALVKFIFIPARVNSKNVAVKIRYTYNFILE